MFVDYYQQQHIATWNPARGVWETNQMSLLCEHSVLFSETWPASGMTLNGQAYELPMPTLLTADTGSLSLPTPTTQDNSGKCRDHGGDLLHELTCGCSRAERKAISQNNLLRTPSVTDSTGGAISETQARERGRMVKTADQMVQLAFENGLKVSPSITAALLPTPMATDGKHTNSPSDRNRNSPPLGTIVHSTNWGRFTPAITRWEQTIGRPAPSPTQPDGKDGAHRLSPHFTEWMMGLPEGWITGCDLSRNAQLKACGNGVVPQQAALALKILDVKL